MKTLFARLWEDGSGTRLVDGVNYHLAPAQPDQRRIELLYWAGSVARTLGGQVQLVLREPEGTSVWHVPGDGTWNLVHSPASAAATRPATGPTRPSPDTVTPPATGQLPAVLIEDWAPLWIVGAHGGAGETTLSQLVPGSRPADHRWLIPADGDESRWIVAARTHATGLAAAQNVLRQWASGAVPPVQLLGLVLIADAPGRLPRELRDQADLVASGSPRTWTLPWYEPWRRGAAPTPSDPPVTRLVEDLKVLSTARKGDLS